MFTLEAKARGRTYAIYVNHRLLWPFHCHVAEKGGEVIGHAGWIAGFEPDLAASQLYLGMVHVRNDARGLGVGRRMIDFGEWLAAWKGCGVLAPFPRTKLRPSTIGVGSPKRLV